MGGEEGKGLWCLQGSERTWHMAVPVHSAPEPGEPPLGRGTWGNAAWPCPALCTEALVLCAVPLHIPAVLVPPSRLGSESRLWARCTVTSGRGAELPELPWAPSLPGKLYTPNCSSWRNCQTAASFPSCFPEWAISVKFKV